MLSSWQPIWRHKRLLSAGVILVTLNLGLHVKINNPAHWHACSLSVKWRRQCVRPVALSFTTHYQCVGMIEHHWPRYFMWSWVLRVPTICPCLLSLAFYTGDIIWSGGSTTASTFCYKNGSRGPFRRETAWQVNYTYVYAMAALMPLAWTVKNHCVQTVPTGSICYGTMSVYYRCHWLRAWTVKNQCVQLGS